MAYIPDNPDLYEFMTGIQYLNFIADVFGGRSADVRQERIRKYAELFELTGDLAQPIAAYSHGMKQKLAIISAWLHEPKLILMDEPFVGLDPKASHLLKGMMRELCDAGRRHLLLHPCAGGGGEAVRQGGHHQGRQADPLRHHGGGQGRRQLWRKSSWNWRESNAEASGEKAAGGDLPQLSLRRQEEPEARSKGTPSALYSVLFVLLMVGVLGGMFTVLSP